MIRVLNEIRIPCHGQRRPRRNTNFAKDAGIGFLKNRLVCLPSKIQQSAPK
jgi:hypothetical protein